VVRMPAASRAGDRRPSAATTSAASASLPFSRTAWTLSAPICQRLHHRPAPLDGRMRGHFPGEGRKQDFVGQVETELIFADLTGAKGDDPTADQAPCPIDDAHHFQRRRPGADLIESAHPLEQLQSGVHQRRGAAIEVARFRPDEQNPKAGIGESECCDQPGRPGARDQNSRLLMMAQDRHPTVHETTGMASKEGI
jgi:hypothetical protein